MVGTPAEELVVTEDPAVEAAEVDGPPFVELGVDEELEAVGVQSGKVKVPLKAPLPPYTMQLRALSNQQHGVRRDELL